MIRKIVTDKAFLSQKSFSCSLERVEEHIRDLIDTATHSPIKCAGLAGNQIGVLERVFIMRSSTNDPFKAIVNPKVISLGGGIGSELETCLSLPNERPIRKRRHKKIKIEYYDIDKKEDVIGTFKRFDARIVQHEMDHFKGILI